MELGSCYGGESLRRGKIGRKEQLLLFLSESFLVRLCVLVLQVNGCFSFLK